MGAAAPLRGADSDVVYVVNHGDDLARVPATATSLELRRIANPDLAALARFSSLQSLNIRGVDFSGRDDGAARYGSFLAGVFSIPTLRSLSLAYTPVLDTVDDAVWAKSAVTHVALDSGYRGSAAELAWLRRLPGLCSLDLRIKVTDVLAYGVLTTLPGLIHLRATLHGLDWPHASFRHFCDAHPLLQSIEINRLSDFSPVELNSVLKHKALTCFRCFETPWTTFANTRALLQKSGLKSLGINTFEWKEAEDIAALAASIESCQSLEELEIWRPTANMGSLLLVAPRRLIVNGQYDKWQLKMPPKASHEEPCRLRELSLSQATLSIRDLWQRPAWFAALTSLSLWGCSVDWAGLAEMPAQTSLRTLDIRECAMGAGELATILRKLPNLENLSAGPLMSTVDTRLEVDHGMTTLQFTVGPALDLGKLLSWFPKGCTVLTLRDAYLDAIAAEQLKKWKSLRCLYLPTCSVEPDPIKDVCNALTDLQVLDLYYSRGLKNSLLEILRTLRDSLFVVTNPEPR